MNKMQRGRYEEVLRPLQQESWMSIPIGIPNCPRGLEYLTALDQFLIQQEKEVSDKTFETQNRYKIKNTLGQNVYFVTENIYCCSRNSIGCFSPFEMLVLDNFQNEVMHLYRPYQCNTCLFSCILQELEVSSPPGTIIGTIEQNWSFIRPLFMIKNAVGEIALNITGPSCPYSCRGSTDFKVSTLNDIEIGKISNQFADIELEHFSETNCFGATFPLDLDVSLKALVTATTFLINKMYFEHQK